MCGHTFDIHWKDRYGDIALDPAMPLWGKSVRRVTPSGRPVVWTILFCHGRLGDVLPDDSVKMRFWWALDRVRPNVYQIKRPLVVYGVRGEHRRGVRGSVRRRIRERMCQRCVKRSVKGCFRRSVKYLLLFWIYSQRRIHQEHVHKIRSRVKRILAVFVAGQEIGGGGLGLVASTGQRPHLGATR